MNFPKIVPNTFVTNQQDTGVWRSELNGTVQVEFDGEVYTVEATRTVGVEIIHAHGFKANGMNRKEYRLSVSYRPECDEHDCRVAGGIVKIAKVFKA